MPPALEARNLNHWTTREVPATNIFKMKQKSKYQCTAYELRILVSEMCIGLRCCHEKILENTAVEDLEPATQAPWLSLPSPAHSLTKDLHLSLSHTHTHVHTSKQRRERWRETDFPLLHLYSEMTR